MKNKLIKIQALGLITAFLASSSFISAGGFNPQKYQIQSEIQKKQTEIDKLSRTAWDTVKNSPKIALLEAEIVSLKAKDASLN